MKESEWDEARLMAAGAKGCNTGGYRGSRPSCEAITVTPLDAICLIICVESGKGKGVCVPKCGGCIDRGGRIVASLMRAGYRLLPVSREGK